MESTMIGRVYVWQLPVRFYHWVNALAVLALAVTGYIIGKPVALAIATEASYSYWFGTARFIHFLAAFLFFVAFYKIRMPSSDKNTNNIIALLFKQCGRN